jgi:hypothetical protein
MEIISCHDIVLIEELQKYFQHRKGQMLSSVHRSQESVRLSPARGSAQFVMTCRLVRPVANVRRVMCIRNIGRMIIIKKIKFHLHCPDIEPGSPR